MGSFGQTLAGLDRSCLAPTQSYPPPNELGTASTNGEVASIESRLASNTVGLDCDRIHARLGMWAGFGQVKAGFDQRWPASNEFGQTSARIWMASGKIWLVSMLASGKLRLVSARRRPLSTEVGAASIRGGISFRSTTASLDRISLSSTDLGLLRPLVGLIRFWARQSWACPTCFESLPQEAHPRSKCPNRISLRSGVDLGVPLGPVWVRLGVGLGSSRGRPRMD